VALLGALFAASGEHPTLFAPMSVAAAGYAAAVGLAWFATSRQRQNTS
jgi:hypothetical protein